MLLSRVVNVFSTLAISICLTAPAHAQTDPVGPFVNRTGTVADMLACLRTRDITLVSAHRGGLEPGFPENAIETFANTLDHFPMLIEMDVRRTKDGVFVLLHDETLDRTTTGSGPVAERTWDQIKDLRLIDKAGTETPYTIPTLKQALDWGRDKALLQLDVKRGAPIDEVARIVAAEQAQGYAAVIAYTLEDAALAGTAAPDITLSIQMTSLEDLDRIEAAGISANRTMAWTGFREERPSLWAGLAGRGVSSAFGTFWYIDRQIATSGDEGRYARLAEAGVDVIATDRHPQAFAALDEHQDTKAAVAACNTN